MLLNKENLNNLNREKYQKQFSEKIILQKKKHYQNQEQRIK